MAIFVCRRNANSWEFVGQIVGGMVTRCRFASNVPQKNGDGISKIRTIKRVGKRCYSCGDRSLLVVVL